MAKDNPESLDDEGARSPTPQSPLAGNCSIGDSKLSGQKRGEEPEPVVS